jgi:hypothetical protein
MRYQLVVPLEYSAKHRGYYHTEENFTEEYFKLPSISIKENDLSHQKVRQTKHLVKLSGLSMKQDKYKKERKVGQQETSIVRSSAAEYLTFVAATGKGGVEAVYADENIWLTQKMMGVLYDVETHTVNYHLKKVFSDSELEADSVIRNFRITAADGKNYNTKHSRTLEG